MGEFDPARQCTPNTAIRGGCHARTTHNPPQERQSVRTSPVRLFGSESAICNDKKKTCLEMGGAGEADARPTFGRSARLGRLLVVVNHRVLPSSPMVGRVSGSSSARTHVSDGVPAQHQTVPAIRPHYLATVEYIYTYGYETAGERTRVHTRSETVYDQRRPAQHQTVPATRPHTTSTEAQGAAPEKERREWRRVGRRRRERGDETTRRPRV